MSKILSIPTKVVLLAKCLALRAIDRTLKAVGSDWHDVVNAITAPPSRLIWGGTATEKQAAWLRAIYLRLRKADEART